LIYNLFIEHAVQLGLGCRLATKFHKKGTQVFQAVYRMIIAVFALLTAHPAWADWYEASSDHFVIYADDKERDIQRFAQELESYHIAMDSLTGRSAGKPSPSNRVVIYVVGGQRDIRELAGGKSRTIAGFYIPRAGGSRAFVQEIRHQEGYPHFSTIVLLHEYAHHFLTSSSRVPMPRWLGEGAAEFFAAATFNDDGSLMIGRAAQHRAGELVRADPVHVRELLDPELYKQQKSGRYDAFYGKSWMLYHYLTFSKEREGQLAQYQLNMVDGMGSLAAGEAAFGNLDALERELKSYLRGQFMTFVINREKLAIGTVTLRKLPPGEAEIMPLVIRSQRGVNAEEAADILAEARTIATRHPQDPGVLAALAEAEFDAGNDAEAISAADRALSLDPANKNALIQKGYALFRQAPKADDRAAAFAAAMRPFEALNALENDHPLPLIYYFRSYAERGAVPPENARAALARAAELAPFDLGLQLTTAMMLITERKHSEARFFLAPIAASPHGGRAAEKARQLLDLLAQTPDGERLDVGRLKEDGKAEEPTGAGS
jgi:Flp pilus assembly protein TadD